MEGGPRFSSAESTDEQRFEATDLDDTNDKKDKKKKKRSSDAGSIHVGRADTQASKEKAEKRQSARENLGELSLAAAFGQDDKQKNAIDSKVEARLAPEEPLDSTELSAKQIANTLLEQQQASEALSVQAQTVEEEVVDGDSVAFDAVETAEHTPAEDAEAVSDIDDELGVTIEGDFTADQEIAVDTPEQSKAASAEASTDSVDDEPDDPTATSAAPPPPTSPSTQRRARPSGGGGGSSAPPTPRVPPTPPSPPPPRPPVPPGGGGPPHGPNSGYNVPPVPPGGPGVNPNQPTWPNQNVGPTVVTEQLRPIEKHNHFFAGLIVGGLYEHFKHKKRENKLKKQHASELGTLQKEQANTKLTLVELTAKQHKNEAEAAWRARHPEVPKAVPRPEKPVPQPEKAVATEAPRVIVHEHTPQRFDEAVEVKQAKPAAERPAVRVGEIITDTVRAAAEVAAGASIAMNYEASKAAPQQTAEQVRQTPHTKEQAPLPVADPDHTQEEPAHVASDRRVETSAWHRIEIDKKTGKAIENPTIAYGEAFQQERHQEVKTQDVSAGLNPVTVTGAAGGGVVGQLSGSSQTTSQTVDEPLPTARNTIEQTQHISEKPLPGGVPLGLLFGLLILVVGAVTYLLLR